MPAATGTTVDDGIVARFDGAGAMAVPDDPDEVVASIFDPVRRGELYPLYARLRTVSPVHRVESGALAGVWLLTRYEDALAVYRSPRAVSDPATAEHFNHGGEGGPFYQSIRHMMLFLEAEEHAAVRRLVARAFTPRAVASVRPVTQAYAEQLVGELGPAGEMDLVSAFAYHLPIRVIAHLLGIDPSDFPVIERLAYDFARGSEGAPVANERTRRADAAAVGFAEYIETLVAKRRLDPRDDLISALVFAEDDGQRLTHEQVTANCILLLQAGHETTTDTIGNAMVALFRHPDQLGTFRREAASTPDAVEELLRYDPTNQFNVRLLLDDHVVGGRRLPAGEQVAVMIGAANRDPSRFEDPDRLRLDRPVSQHLSFAHGLYYCLGSSLARAELEVALRTLLDRLPGLRPAGETFTWRDTLRNRGPRRLPVAWGR